MIKVNKDSIVGVSVGSLMVAFIGVGSYAWSLSDDVNGYINQIAANTLAISSVSTALRLRGVTDELADLRSELRDRKLEFRKDPDNDLLAELIIDIEDEILELDKVRICILDGKEICE